MESSLRARQLSGLSRWEAVYELVKFLAVLFLFAQVSFADSGTYLNIIKSHSPTLLLVATEGVSKDTNGKVSSWKDLVNGVDFVQGTADNKPSLRRTDNKENYLVISEPQDHTQTAYEAGTYSFVDSVEAEWQGLISGKVVKLEPHATATEVYVASPLYRLAGTTYRYSFYIRREDGGVVKVGAHNDNTADCVLIYTGAATANIATAANIQTESLGSGLYRVSYEGTRTLASAVSGYIGVTKYAANSANNVLVSGFQMTSLEASTEYLPIRTYNAPQYRKISEVPSLFFNGATSSLTSAATLADIFAAGDKTAFFVFKSDSVAIQRRLFKSSDDRIIVYNPATATILCFYNNDGSADNVSATGFTANDIHIFAVWQTGGTLYGQLNGGPIASVASGNTSALTGTLVLGAHSGEYFLGDLYSMVTYKTALDEADRTEVYNALSNYIASKPKGEWQVSEGGRPWFR